MPHLSQWDTAWYLWVNQSPRLPGLELLMQAASAVGTWGAVFIAIAGFLAWRRRGLAVMGAWRVVLAVTLAVFVSDGILKPWVGRPRPWQANPQARVEWVKTANGSFPSGHAAAAGAGAYALTLLWPRRRALAWAIAVMICCSRVYIGVHYPLDVCAGLVVGLACAGFATCGTSAFVRPAAASTG